MLRLVLIVIDVRLHLLSLIRSMHVKICFLAILRISIDRSSSTYQIERRIPTGISSRLRLVKRLEGEIEKNKGFFGNENVWID